MVGGQGDRVFQGKETASAKILRQSLTCVRNGRKVSLVGAW